MKLRILGNSIRLRLSEEELKTLEENREVVEHLHFPSGTIFIYSLKIAETANYKSEFLDNKLSVIIPQAIAYPWLTSKDVSLTEKLPLPDSESLKLLIEKDLPCKH